MPDPHRICSRAADTGIQQWRETRRVAILSLIAWRTPPERYGAWETGASNTAMAAGSFREVIDPAPCRQRVEKQVSIDSMLDGYERVYANFFSNSSGGTNRSRSGVG